MTLKEFSILDDDTSLITPILVGEPIEGQTQPTTEGTEQEEEKIDITKLVPEEEKHLVTPAGVGGAIVGFIFGGPILSALVGFGAAYAIRKKNGAGDAARALGELTISVQDKAAKIEEKNKYFEKTKTSVGDMSNKLPSKVRGCFVSSWFAVSNYTKENQLIERGVEGTGKGFEFISSSISGLSKKSDNEKERENYTFVSNDEAQHYPANGVQAH
mmetsp:Transcript_13740/g.28825  ORF Transcript_13740/g.28825 Transcript_13740/m.28825 type:complete len:215 (-) Transcript_13740:129-773(-)|eukprot:CAMPEP_0168166516 /NCGR_PEP_ID=MMETSP0139_2-20121125/2067_1 /TAXON_ID=44445 /ORGANISM="Pseudo-nitzschia australis, Strain 10249 10 AB" /LENGTH=214 /DNA_ID=CAMNT_0008083715 /DNA_START=84 /DNA_END=728 /DNA_ORIENTATION=+